MHIGPTPTLLLFGGGLDASVSLSPVVAEADSFISFSITWALVNSSIGPNSAFLPTSVVSHVCISLELPLSPIASFELLL